MKMHTYKEKKENKHPEINKEDLPNNTDEQYYHHYHQADASARSSSVLSI